MSSNIYEYITAEENRYQNVPVHVADGYDWSMFDHVRTTTLYLNSRYKTGNQDDLPFRQIILPKRNLTHRAMDFIMREIDIYVNSSGKYHLSFLARKYHEYWAPKHNIPNFLDGLTETYDDYGGVLIENTREDWRVVPFQLIAFCDQTDLLGGPIGLKHQFSPDRLKEMEANGWGDSKNRATHTIDEVITLVSKQQSSGEKGNSQMESGAVKSGTPGRYIEVYDVEGVMPESFLDPAANEHKYTYQLQVVTFYKDDKGDKQWITLFAGKKKPGRYKFKKRDDEDNSTFGRALGRGGVEELFEAQVWINYNEIQKKELLDQAAKVLYQTTDQKFTGQNVKQYDTGQVVTTAANATLTQVNNSKPDVVAFENAVQAWDNSAKDIASAWDTISGAESKSGMPFRLGALLNQEAHSMHRYRKSKLGNFLAFEVYPDWFLPKMQKEVAKGEEFLSTLSLEEMKEVAESVARCQLNDKLKQRILAGGDMMEPGETDEMLEMYKQEFMDGGTKRFIKILEGELQKLPLIVQFNLTGEQKDQYMMVEKMSSIFTQVTQILLVYPTFFSDFPEMAKLFNEIIESSGLSPLMFGMNGYKPMGRPAMPMQPAAGQSPVMQQPNAKTAVPGQPQAA